MHDPIDDYLRTLASSLATPSKGRITAEVAQHLADIAEEERRNGATPEQAQASAVRRFGPADALAAEFNRDEARHALSRAVRGISACVVVAFAAAWPALRTGAPAQPWPSGLAFYTAYGFLAEVALACALNAVLLTLVAPRLCGVALEGRPAQLAVRSLAVACAALLPVALIAAGNLGVSAPLPERLLLTAVAAGVALATFLSATALRRSPALTTSVRRNAPKDHADQAAEDVLDVIALVCQAAAERWSFAAAAYRLAVLTWQAVQSRAPYLIRWVDLRHHPWRSASTVSVLAGVGLAAPDLLLQGDPDLAKVAVQAAVVYVSFALLGSLLGLRGRTTASTQAVRLSIH